MLTQRTVSIHFKIIHNFYTYMKNHLNKLIKVFLKKNQKQGKERGKI